MLYVLSRLHQAMRQVALDEGRSASDVYAEAASRYLAERGVTVKEEPEHAPPAQNKALTIEALAAAIGRQEQMIEEIRSALATGRTEAMKTDPAQAGVKAAEAMQAVLAVLNEAGADGLSAPELSRMVQGCSVEFGAEEKAKAILRTVGLVRYEDRRWYLGGPAPSVLGPS